MVQVDPNSLLHPLHIQLVVAIAILVRPPPPYKPPKMAFSLVLFQAGC